MDTLVEIKTNTNIPKAIEIPIKLGMVKTIAIKRIVNKIFVLGSNLYIHDSPGIYCPIVILFMKFHQPFD